MPRDNIKKDTSKSELIKRVVSEFYFSKKEISQGMRMSRGTFYNKLNAKKISRDFIAKLSLFLDYSFVEEFPEYKEYIEGKMHEKNPFYSVEDSKSIKEVEAKYFILLEEYNRLLKFIIKISNGLNPRSLSLSMHKFLKKERFLLKKKEGISI